MEKKSKKTTKRIVTSGIVSVQSTFNNTIVSICDEDGALLAQGSPANVGYKGSKRSTAFAATRAAQFAAENAIKKYGLRDVKVFIKGPGTGRNAAVKGLDSAGLKVTLLTDRTPVPHNGCRSRKAPRK